MNWLAKIVFIVLMITTVITSTLALNKDRFNWFVSGVFLGFSYAIASWLI